MKVTICFGGSIFNPKGLDLGVIKEIAETIRELRRSGTEMLVVTGGGNTARSYINAAKELNVPQNKMDELGIEATRLNAKLLIQALGDIAGDEPPRNFQKAVEISLENKIPVMGGTKPGHTTDAVAAKLAESSKSDLLVYFTDVEGVYTADPDRDEDAKKISSMSASELSDLMEKMGFEPGMTAIIDPLAAEIIQKSGIKTLVLGKEELENLKEILEGAEHSGTVIKPRK